MQFQETQSDLLQPSNVACIICAELFTGTERVPTTIQCGHTGVCSVCFLRLRTISRDFNCPQCKQPCENVVCTVATNKRYEDFEAWGEQMPGFHFDHVSRMFFPPDHHREVIEPLRKAVCNICNVVKRDVKSLRSHLINEHKLQMCQLCIDFKHSFPSEQKIYTQQEYEMHLKKGDGDGSEGHPNCEFCKRRYYDKNALFLHLQRDHFECHICVRYGVQFKYYNKYENLEDHFREEHILCEEPSCLEKRYVVFSNEIDYSSHMVQYHPQKASGHKSINIQFHSNRHRQRNIDSSADEHSLYSFNSADRFEGGVSGRSRNGTWHVELPESARDPREGSRSATGRDAAFVEAGGYSQFSGSSSNAAAAVIEDFPSLSPSSSQLELSGGSSGLGADSFPSLGGGAAPVIPASWGGGFKTDKRLGRKGINKSNYKNSNSSNGNNDVSHTKPQGPGRVDANASGNFRTAASGFNWQSRVDAVNLNYGTAASKAASSSSAPGSFRDNSIYDMLGGLGGVSISDQYAAFARYQPAYQQREGVSPPPGVAAPTINNDPLAHLVATTTPSYASIGATIGTVNDSMIHSNSNSSQPPLDLGANIKVKSKQSKKKAPNQSAPTPLEPEKEASLNNLAYKPPPKKKEAVKQQQINNISNLSNMLSSMGMGPKKPNLKAKQSGITGAVAGHKLSHGDGDSSGSGSEVSNMLKSLQSDLKHSAPAPPGFAPSSAGAPPGFDSKSCAPPPGLASTTNDTDCSSSSSSSSCTGGGKKPQNWTKIGGVTHTTQPVDLVKPTGPVSSSEYPSLPPAPPDDSDWSNVSKRLNNSSSKSFISAASKEPSSKPSSISVSSANIGKDSKSNNEKAKKGIKNQKKVRQDLMSLMTGK